MSILLKNCQKVILSTSPTHFPLKLRWKFNIVQLELYVTDSESVIYLTHEPQATVSKRNKF